jgi:hypothetical protein
MRLRETLYQKMFGDVLPFVDCERQSCNLVYIIIGHFLISGIKMEYEISNEFNKIRSAKSQSNFFSLCFQTFAIFDPHLIMFSSSLIIKSVFYVLNLAHDGTCFRLSAHRYGKYSLPSSHQASRSAPLCCFQSFFSSRNWLNVSRRPAWPPLCTVPIFQLAILPPLGRPAVGTRACGPRAFLQAAASYRVTHLVGLVSGG